MTDSDPFLQKMNENSKIVPPAPYQFSPEELKVFRECNIESFFQRSLPLGTILGTGTYYAIKAGYLKSSLKYGTVPKVVSAVIVGYFVGKISYQWKCAEKFMQLPNSEVGAMLRKRKSKGGFIQDPLGVDLSSTFASSGTSDMQNTNYSDTTPNTFTDLDTDRPYNRGLDDTFRPSLDSPHQIRDEDYVMPPNSSQSVASYEELRRKNREEYEQRRTKPYRGVVTPEEIPATLPPRDFNQRPSEGSWNAPKNKYGDVFEK